MKNKYYFEGIRWIPSYEDFDYDNYAIEAENEDEAWEKLFSFTNKKFWKTVSITKIETPPPPPTKHFDYKSL